MLAVITAMQTTNLKRRMLLVTAKTLMQVLVDAECTHDSSLTHITKYEQWGWETFERGFLNEERIASIASLQLRLLRNGFRLPNPGGTLVHSTCSFTKGQNEGVLERFLSTHGGQMQNCERWRAQGSGHLVQGGLPHTLCFDPVASNTSELFMAKLTKLGLDPDRPASQRMEEIEELGCLANLASLGQDECNVLLLGRSARDM